jgi:hypothetical protein
MDGWHMCVVIMLLETEVKTGSGWTFACQVETLEDSHLGNVLITSRMLRG